MSENVNNIINIYRNEGCTTYHDLRNGSIFKVPNRGYEEVSKKFHQIIFSKFPNNKWKICAIFKNRCVFIINKNLFDCDLKGNIYKQVYTIESNPAWVTYKDKRDKYYALHEDIDYFKSKFKALINDWFGKNFNDSLYRLNINAIMGDKKCYFSISNIANSEEDYDHNVYKYNDGKIILIKKEKI